MDEDRNAIIKAIDKTTVHRICSGQVVLSLATAVKELVENAIDAGSTSVEIKLKEYGSEVIEVSDNGQGVHPNDFESLTLKHHTSKLRDFSDLMTVETFGFRGEALSSLCSLCDLSIVTRHYSQECATSLSFDHNGRILKKLQCPRQVGTSVSLANVFSSLPVRQKEFHKNIKREFNKMLQLLYAYCLVSSSVKISCTNQTKSNRTKVVATQGSGNIKDSISCVFGPKQVKELFELKNRLPSADTLEELKMKPEDADVFNITGLVSSCAHGCGRRAPDRQFFLINSRPCDLPKVSKLVNEVYHQYNVHQYPFVFLDIRMTKTNVDVNVTPDKRQIFVNREKMLLAIVRNSLEATYESTPSTFRVNQVVSESTSDESVPNLAKPSLTSLLSAWRSKNDLKRPMEDGYESVAKKKSFHPTSPKLTAFFEKKSQIQPKRGESSKQEQTELFEITGVDSGLPDAVDSQEKNARGADSEEGAISSNILRENPEVKDEIRQSVDPNANSNAGAWRCPSVESDETVAQSRRTVSCAVGLIQIKNSIGGEQAKDVDELSIKFRAAIDPKQNKEAEKELIREISMDDFDKMEIIGQFNLSFIVAKLGSDLFIIDQHASDEKFNFETLQKTTTIVSQTLVVPQPLELTADSEMILRHNLEVFTRNGFKFKFEDSEISTKRVFLTAVPMSKNCVFGKKDVDELLFMLQDNPTDTSTCRPSSVRAMFASRACRKSVMIGTALSRKDMKKIVSQMGTIDHPWNCPHGRPTMRHLINLDLVKS